MESVYLKMPIGIVKNRNKAMHRIGRYFYSVVSSSAAFCFVISFLSGCRSVPLIKSETDYGVYLSDDYEALPGDLSTDLLVIDAQYFTAEEITALHEKNGRIYSYINVGAVENFRAYYEDYSDLTLGPYENWPEERFVDVSDKCWQDFIVNELVSELQGKGIDGFFVDNADVYYEYQTQEIFDGLTEILKGLKDTGLSVIINGGDVFVSGYYEKNGRLEDILDGVNQEFVFTSVNWEQGTFGKSDEDSENYYLEYLKTVQASGAEIFLLEYTDDQGMAEQILEKADELGYTVYISDSIELD